MPELMTTLMKYSVIAINAMALLVILVGSLQMLASSFAAIVSPSTMKTELRKGYVHFARWLIAGLTFLLAADIIDTIITPDWDEIGRLAATAAIRTFLNYFLERDLEEALSAESAGDKRPLER